MNFNGRVGRLPLHLFIIAVSLSGRVPRDFHGSENSRAFLPSLRDPALRILDLILLFRSRLLATEIEFSFRIVSADPRLPAHSTASAGNLQETRRTRLRRLDLNASQRGDGKRLGHNIAAAAVLLLLCELDTILINLQLIVGCFIYQFKQQVRHPACSFPIS